MSARAARPGELVTSACKARRLLCRVSDEDLPADVGRGTWTVTESGPMLGISSESTYSAYSRCFQAQTIQWMYMMGIPSYRKASFRNTSNLFGVTNVVMVMSSSSKAFDAL